MFLHHDQRANQADLSVPLITSHYEISGTLSFPFLLLAIFSPFPQTDSLLTGYFTFNRWDITVLRFNILIIIWITNLLKKTYKPWTEIKIIFLKQFFTKRQCWVKCRGFVHILLIMFRNQLFRSALLSGFLLMSLITSANKGLAL